MRRLFFCLGTLLSLLLMAGCSQEQSVPEVQPVEKGQPFPPVMLQSLSGEKQSSASVFVGKVVVLNIWATWCPPCRQEMPDLIKLAQLLPPDKFLVVGLATDRAVEDVRAFAAEKRINFPLFWDKDGDLASSVGVFRYPETFIINDQGVVIEKISGAFPWSDPQMVGILKYIQEHGVAPPPDAKL